MMQAQYQIETYYQSWTYEHGSAAKIQKMK
jgi:hypothetical protein